MSGIEGGREDLIEHCFRIGPILAFLLNSKERLRKPWERAVQAFNITLEAILEGDQQSVYQVSECDFCVYTCWCTLTHDLLYY